MSDIENLKNQIESSKYIEKNHFLDMLNIVSQSDDMIQKSIIDNNPLNYINNNKIPYTNQLIISTVDIRPLFWETGRAVGTRLIKNTFIGNLDFSFDFTINKFYIESDISEFNPMNTSLELYIVITGIYGSFLVDNYKYVNMVQDFPFGESTESNKIWFKFVGYNTDNILLNDFNEEKQNHSSNQFYYQSGGAQISQFFLIFTEI